MLCYYIILWYDILHILYDSANKIAGHIEMSFKIPWKYILDKDFSA